LARRLENIIADWKGRVTGPTARQGAGALLDQGIASFTNFVTTVIVGRACAPAQLGYYSLGASLVLLVLAVQRNLIAVPYIVTAPRLRGRPLARYTGSTLVHNMGLTAVAMLGILGMSLVAGLSPSGGDLAAVLRLLSVVLAFITLRRLARLICFARLRLEVAVVMDIGVLGLQVGGLALLWRLGLVSAETAYWTVGMAAGVAGLAWLAAMGKQMSVSARHVRVHWRRNWVFARWLLLGVLALSASMQAYPWLLTWFRGAGATGVLQACLSIAYLSNPFVYGTSNLLAAKCAHAMASGGKPALRKTVLHGTIYIGAVMLVLVAVIVLAGDFLVTTLFGADYSGHTATLAVLALNQLALALMVSVTGGLLALKRSDIMLASFLLAPAITLTAGPWLAKGLGPTGVAASMLACNIAMLCVRAVCFRRLIRRPDPRG
jgi:O-antigen/teichoic acid export membrane protein